MKKRCPWLYDGYDWKARYIALAMLLAVAVLVVAVCLLIQAVESHECALAARQLHRASSYHFLGGCYVDIGHGQKVPLENYNAFRGAR